MNEAQVFSLVRTIMKVAAGVVPVGWGLGNVWADITGAVLLAVSLGWSFATHSAPVDPNAA